MDSGSGSGESMDSGSGFVRSMDSGSGFGESMDSGSGLHLICSIYSACANLLLLSKSLHALLKYKYIVTFWTD